MPYFSIVTSVYKTEAYIDELYNRLAKAMKELGFDFEVIFVNDASPDNSWNLIKNLTNKDQRVKGINFSRNFGQHFAITAGLDHAQGDWVVVMDCDLQDRPEDIKKLYQKTKEGFDVVFGRRAQRKDKLTKKLSSKLFYLVLNYFTDSKYDSSVANFSISQKAVIDNFKKMREHSRSFPLFIKWMGFNIGYVNITHTKRHGSKSGYSLIKLLHLATDSIVSQSNKPLKLSIKLGFSMSFLSFIYAIFLFVLHIMYDRIVPGWTSLMVSIFFLSGLILANMGILGLYIGKTFDESKNRPLYIIKETIGKL